MKRSLCIVAFLMIVLLFCTACGGNKAETRALEVNGDYIMQEMAMNAPMDTAADSGYSEELKGEYNTGAGTPNPAPSEQLESPQYGGRKIIRTLSIELRTNEFDKQVAALKNDVQKAGGYVQDSNVYGTKPEVAGDAGRNCYFSVRIPAEQADAFMAAAAEYGTVLSQNESTQDVTDSYFDIETRLEVSRTSLQRLKDILVKTNNLADIIALEQEISSVTYDIESLTSNLRKYDGMIEYATINVTINEEGMKIGPAAKTPFGQRVVDGFTETASDVGNFIEDLAVFVLAGTPVFIPLVAIILFIVWLCKRRRAVDIINGMPIDLPDSQKRAWRAAHRRAKKAGLPYVKCSVCEYCDGTAHCTNGNAPHCGEFRDDGDCCPCGIAKNKDE